MLSCALSKPLSLVLEIVVERHRARTTEDERGKASKIEQANFVPWRPELGAPGHHTHQLDRAEPIRQVDGKNCYEEKYRHWQANKGDESSEQDGEAADELGQNGKPCHEMRRRDAQRM